MLRIGRYWLQWLLGGERRNIFLDLRFLRPWARHIISKEDSIALLKLVIAYEVKLTFFDILEDKSRGPDGYSSGFFKVSWPVVGEQVTRAILDFFAIGKSLTQVKSILIVLIPNAQDPNLVVDFCPIDCCNVIYKVIMKILVTASSSPLRTHSVWAILADVASISTFKRGLEMFADISGLHANPNKSHLIISSFVCTMRDSLLVKVDTCIKGWEGIKLSFAGCVQLIRTVLMALNVYWAMAFILPKGIIREVEKRSHSFLWKGLSGRGYSKVSWQQVCRWIEEGGLGLYAIFSTSGPMSIFVVPTTDIEWDFNVTTKGPQTERLNPRSWAAHSTGLVLELEESWQSHAYEDCILDMARGGYAMEHGHHKPYPV
ncbi:hypothetical protein Sango_3006000 [Sesamum angolense]|uniref:Uncharacterized protein n=1 Tax=Sesamum angolense TaxID=2727404 RepID=A0AAE1T3U5_9LAMI|nr:hypothetical protein Sango_3006000 [Sesamum angolense]